MSKELNMVMEKMNTIRNEIEKIGDEEDPQKIKEIINLNMEIGAILYAKYISIKYKNER
ncbi:hypothetical protein HS7_00530 [Sulfolobales archaeon HS-7]|nr:hypothetical protein HS7_00530 [Sulfolobales archaeon HS-7]